MRKIFFAAALIAVSACGHSPPTHYFSLDAVDGGVSKAGARLIRVGAVHLPPDLDRLSMVRGRDGSELRIDDQSRWSGPLDGLIQITLARDLMQRLPGGNIVLPRAPAPGASTLALTIATFAPDADGAVTLDGTWSVLDSGSDAPVVRRTVHLTEPGGNTPATEATAMSRIIGKLADDIVEALAPR